MNQSILVVLSAVLGLTMATESRGAVNQNLWNEIESLVLKCAVVPVRIDENGNKTYGALKSICPELVVTGKKATFTLGKVTYESITLDSDEGDYGDLNDVIVRRLKNRQTVARRTQVPSFGDVLMSLAGGEREFREELER